MLGSPEFLGLPELLGSPEILGLPEFSVAGKSHFFRVSPIFSPVLAHLGSPEMFFTQNLTKMVKTQIFGQDDFFLRFSAL